MEPRKIGTLGLLIRNDCLALAEKKVGRFGAGQLNGPGGKPQEGETLVECLVRETKEEFGIDLDPTSVGEPVALIDFYAGDALDFRVHVYRIEEYGGDLRETEEMHLPQEYPLDAIPYERMMEADRHWLPLVLAAPSGTCPHFESDYAEAGKGFQGLRRIT